MTTSSNPYVTGNYAPIDFETTAFALPVRGRIPDGLDGRLLRIGPNPTGVPNVESSHWFIGTGMVHGLRLTEGRAAWYRSRYVRAGSGARLLGTELAPGPAGNDDSSVNTTVLRLGDAVYACVEAGAYPVRLDGELESVSRTTLGGGLTRGFAAHAKTDPLTGEHHAIAYRPGVPRVEYLVVGTDGVARRRGEIELPHMPLVHDVGLTQTSVVVLDLPVTFSPADIREGNFPYRWDAKRDGRVGLLPRDGDASAIRWFAAPRCFVFHFLNCYDDGDRVVIDVCRHPRMFASGESDIGEGKSVLARWTLDRARGTLSETIVDDRGTEFPRLNGARESLPYRFGYTASSSDTGKLGPIMKHDMLAGSTAVHDFGPGRIAQEPIFVARPGATDEDDGYVMTYVYDTARDASDVVILDARDFPGAPVATIELPVRVPFGFHGNWIAAS